MVVWLNLHNCNYTLSLIYVLNFVREYDHQEHHLHKFLIISYRVTAMTSFSLHFSMANSNAIACFVGLPLCFFTN